MKKTTLTSLSLLLVLILAACGGNSPERNSNPDNTDPTTMNFEMPVEMKLMLGTVKLDETEFAIDPEQASDLLPLWKTLRSLSSSETAAQAEVDAVISAIQEAMTTEQMAAIEAMGLTMKDFTGVAETLGLETGFGGRFGEITPEMQATMEAARESGEFPSEGFEGGFVFGGGQGPGGGQGRGGGFGGEPGFSPEMRETAIAERGDTFGRGFGINTALLDGIIAFLEAK